MFEHIEEKLNKIIQIPDKQPRLRDGVRLHQDMERAMGRIGAGFRNISTRIEDVKTT